ncbi:hypothetical protein LOTGIDRAFT_172126 [Lottia gigantea]|uniref:Spaetzle domain-containing protein n=1 Tax=Lottia gigantea TaxID=225164 RepID=V4B9X8_LOTGI|nr:hypothetical protein LOTGIDRAFT_172126 [Lottia gigantea]ESP02372.1 hypothetical protein LOTGIDRAFT_172126 [Lottia gigantea]
MIHYVVISVLVQLVLGQHHNTTEHNNHQIKPTPPAFKASPLVALPVQQTSFHDPTGRVSCSISIADDTDTLHLTDDDFGYPKYMVEDAFRSNNLATQMFDLYLRKHRMVGDPMNQHVHTDNTNTISETVAQLKPHQGQVINPFAGTHNGNNQRNILFGNEVSQPFQTNNYQSPFINSNSFPKHQNGGGFQGFDFSSPISNTKDKANIVTNGFHFPTGGIPIFRKKRMSGFQTSFSGFKTPKHLCDSQTVQLKRYQNYGGKCFVLEPEVQNINFVKCRKQKCSNCNGFNGVTQCAAETRDLWVWSYCEALPRDKKIIYDKILIPTHCACKTFEC